MADTRERDGPKDGHGANASADTPGRPKDSGSRQQVRPDQATDPDTPHLDASEASQAHGKRPKYRDRPANEGKHGDGDQEPNPR